jgi:acyl dehydratase
MKMLVADGQRLSREMAARGEKVAVWGPSPGFRELRWIKPALAGDSITYATEITSLRISEKRPEWGIMQARITGTNQRDELVYSLLTTAFVPRRKAA